jgi:hypothetical protein
VGSDAIRCYRIIYLYTTLVLLPERHDGEYDHDYYIVPAVGILNIYRINYVTTFLLFYKPNPFHMRCDA